MAYGPLVVGGSTVQTAADVNYDNRVSKIDATNVQDAIDVILSKAIPEIEAVAEDLIPGETYLPTGKVVLVYE